MRTIRLPCFRVSVALWTPHLNSQTDGNNSSSYAILGGIVPQKWNQGLMYLFFTQNWSMPLLVLKILTQRKIYVLMRWKWSSFMNYDRQILWWAKLHCRSEKASFCRSHWHVRSSMALFSWSWQNIHLNFHLVPVQQIAHQWVVTNPHPSYHSP